MPDPDYARYTLREVTIDGPALSDGDEAAIRLLVAVTDDWSSARTADDRSLGETTVGFPLTLRVNDWEGPWREPLTAVPNPLGDAVRELRALRAKWASKGVSIRGSDLHDGLEVTHGTSRVPIHALEAPVHYRAIPRRSGA